MTEDKKDHYNILELLAKLADYKGVSYEIDEIKDGRIYSLKNIRIEKVTLRQKD